MVEEHEGELVGLSYCTAAKHVDQHCGAMSRRLHATYLVRSSRRSCSNAPVPIRCAVMSCCETLGTGMSRNSEKWENRFAAAESRGFSAPYTIVTCGLRCARS